MIARFPLDFIAVKEEGGDLGVLAAQVCRGIAWVYKNAASLGGDPDRVQAAIPRADTSAPSRLSLPRHMVKGELCMSGIYEMAPVQLLSSPSAMDKLR